MALLTVAPDPIAPTVPKLTICILITSAAVVEADWTWKLSGRELVAITNILSLALKIPVVVGVQMTYAELVALILVVPDVVHIPATTPPREVPLPTTRFVVLAVPVRDTAVEEA